MKKVNNIMEMLEIDGQWAILDSSSNRKFNYNNNEITLKDISKLYDKGWELVTVDALNYQYVFKKIK